MSEEQFNNQTNEQALQVINSPETHPKKGIGEKIKSFRNNIKSKTVKSIGLGMLIAGGSFAPVENMIKGNEVLKSMGNQSAEAAEVKSESMLGHDFSVEYKKRKAMGKYELLGFLVLNSRNINDKYNPAQLAKLNKMIEDLLNFKQNFKVNGVLSAELIDKEISNVEKMSDSYNTSNEKSQNQLTGHDARSVEYRFMIEKKRLIALKESIKNNPQKPKKMEAPKKAHSPKKAVRAEAPKQSESSEFLESNEQLLRTKEALLQMDAEHKLVASQFNKILRGLKAGDINLDDYKIAVNECLKITEEHLITLDKMRSNNEKINTFKVEMRAELKKAISFFGDAKNEASRNQNNR